MRITVEYSSRFIRTIRKIDADLQTEILEKIELLKGSDNHKRLKVHTLTGKLKGIWSFSVNYRIRVTFSKQKKDALVLETVGTHDEVY
ncbi:MAG: type II toxin-antitoxin system RelE/ParE family toxin [Minisyncoccia bacterium]